MKNFMISFLSACLIRYISLLHFRYQLSTLNVIDSHLESIRPLAALASEKDDIGGGVAAEDGGNSGIDAGV